jgi:hypothetical protein
MHDPYGAFYAAFLQDHPEELAGVKVVPLAGEQTLTMTINTLRHFLTWALAMGYVTHEEKALAYLDGLPELEARARTIFTSQRATPNEQDNLLNRRAAPDA